MNEALINVVIWYSGLIGLLVVMTIGMAIVACLLFLASEHSGKRLMRLVRFETARYWVNRMEREGLTLPQKEYRAMVEVSKPKTAKDFIALDRIERNRIMDEHMGNQ